MWPFSSAPVEPALLPDIKRVPNDPRFKAVFDEYRPRRGKEKVGWGFEGGGRKGMHQAGFMAYVAQVGFMEFVDVLGGTSVGGLNATLITRYIDESPDLQKVVDIWRGIKHNTDVYTGSLSIPSILWTLLRQGKSATSLLDSTPLQRTIDKHLAGFSNFRIPVYVVATGFSPVKCLILGPGTPASDQAKSTSRVPMAFGVYQGKIDGGVMMNNAAPFLLGLGVTKMGISYCDPDPVGHEKTYTDESLFTQIAATLDGLFASQELRVYDWVEGVAELRRLKGESPLEVAHFYPSDFTGDMLDFETHRDLLQKGYDDAVKYFTPEKVAAFLVA